jgi:hypothetical protein
VGSQREDNIIVEPRTLTRGGDSNLAWRSLIRLLLPFIRNVPSISVAVLRHPRNRGMGHEVETGKGISGSLCVCVDVKRMKRTLFFQIETTGIT